MSAATFLGTGVAIVTPFLQKGEIDWDGLNKLIHHLSDGKVCTERKGQQRKENKLTLQK